MVGDFELTNRNAKPHPNPDPGCERTLRQARCKGCPRQRVSWLTFDRHLPRRFGRKHVLGKLGALSPSQDSYIGVHSEIE